MLLVCPHCAQVIEISSYNKHLVEDCQEAKKFRMCPRCKEPIHVNKYNEHIAEKACHPSQPISVANRCPLCHTDIEAGPEGWRKHLTV
jgi:centrosomal protein CEP104